MSEGTSTPEARSNREESVAQACSDAPDLDTPIDLIPADRHPMWCAEEPYGDNLEHRSAGARWDVEHDDARISVQLVRLDDRQRTPQANTRVLLTIHQTGICHADGAPMIASVHLGPADIAMLQRSLTRELSSSARYNQRPEHWEVTR